MSSAPRVLLVGGDDRSMLAAARSLSRRDVPFLILGVGRRTMVGSSRVVRPRAVGPMPDARAEPEVFVSHLLDVARRYEVDLVLPTTDRTIYACAKHREAIEDEARLAAPPTPAVLNVLDKPLNLRTARRLGIPTPGEFELERLEQVPELIVALGFPIVLKNPGPAAEGERPHFGFRVLVARDEDELRRHLDRCPAGYFPVVQRLVSGAVRNICCLAIRGEIAAVHEYTSLRRRMGSSVFREITPLGADLRRYAELMLGELCWDGVAHLGFYVDESGARYMETNGRFWASVAGSVSAGWDFPYWMYDYFAYGRAPEPMPPSHGLGHQSRWHFGDLATLVGYLSGSDEPSGHGPTRLRALAGYLAGFRPRVKADVFRVSDPLPELIELWRGARLALSRHRNRHDAFS